MTDDEKKLIRQQLRESRRSRQHDKKKIAMGLANYGDAGKEEPSHWQAVDRVVLPLGIKTFVNGRWAPDPGAREMAILIKAIIAELREHDVSISLQTFEQRYKLPAGTVKNNGRGPTHALFFQKEQIENLQKHFK